MTYERNPHVRQFHPTYGTIAAAIFTVKIHDFAGTPYHPALGG